MTKNSSHILTNVRAAVSHLKWDHFLEDHVINVLTFASLKKLAIKTNNNIKKKQQLKQYFKQYENRFK